MAEAFMRIKDPRINSGVLFLIADGKDPNRKILGYGQARVFQTICKQGRSLNVYFYNENNFYIRHSQQAQAGGFVSSGRGPY